MEVDIISRRNDKSELYARLGIAEFWRYRNDLFQAFALKDSVFASIDVSRSAWRRWLGANRHHRDSSQTPFERAYSEAQTSSLVLTFAMTASVNSVVEEWPPRSLVAVPSRTLSRTPS